MKSSVLLALVATLFFLGLATAAPIGDMNAKKDGVMNMDMDMDKNEKGHHDMNMDMNKRGNMDMDVDKKNMDMNMNMKTNDHDGGDEDSKDSNDTKDNNTNDNNNNNAGKEMGTGMDKRQLGTLDYLAGAQGSPVVGAVGNLAPHGNVMNSVKKLPLLGQLGNFGNPQKSSGSH